MNKIVIFIAAGICLLAALLFYVDYRMGSKERRILIDDAPIEHAVTQPDEMLTPMPE